MREGHVQPGIRGQRSVAGEFALRYRVAV